MGEQAVYGIWLIKHSEWLMSDGVIVSSDFIGLMKAQLMVHNKQGGTTAEVKEIGPDGLPVEVTIP